MASDSLQWFLLETPTLSLLFFDWAFRFDFFLSFSDLSRAEMLLEWRILFLFLSFPLLFLLLFRLLHLAG